MIEIKSRYDDGKVLYTAKDATDVRAALVEAVNAGANLAGAYLAGAYLAGAYLAGAYLAGANLAGAYLVGADLAAADLAGADLAGANLAGADLAGADLAGANLAAAYLVGAYLAAANLARGMWQQVAAKLTEALALMNDGGKHWIKGALEGGRADGSKTYCSVGSVNASSEGTVRTVALWLLSSVAAGSVESFNDHPGTTWEDVWQVFRVAIRNAERFAAA